MDMLTTIPLMPIVPYEHKGIVELPENDTLTWLNETEEDEELKGD